MHTVIVVVIEVGRLMKGEVKKRTKGVMRCKPVLMEISRCWDKIMSLEL